MESTEERILQAAEVEFFSKGFDGARTTAIAEAAGVTHAMLHYYFRTKEKLFSRVVDKKLESIAATLVLNVDADGTLTECIRKTVESHFDFIRANPLMPRFMVCEVFANGKLIAELKRKFGVIAAGAIGNLQVKIDRAAEAGECVRVDAVALMMDIVSLNIFPILAAPMLCGVLDMTSGQSYEKFLDARKEENVRTILRRIAIKD